MKSKKILSICLVAVLSLTLMGFGFAKWTDSVVLEGKVATGNIGVNIESVGCNDQGADPQKWPGKNTEGKDVASCSMVQDGTQKIKLNIDNAYPWYAPEFTFRINGTGTVPVRVENLQYSNPIWSGQLGKFIQLENWQIRIVNPASHGLPAENRTINSTNRNNTWQGLANALKLIQVHKNGYIEVKVGMYIQETISGGGCGTCDVGDEGDEGEYTLDGHGHGPGHGTSLCPQDASSSATMTFNFAQWNEVY